MKICENMLCRQPHRQRKSSYCANCTEERNRERNREYNTRRAEHHAFYDSKEWRELRAIKLAQNPVCEVCWEKGRLTMDKLLVHHVVELTQDYGLRLTLSNLQTVCVPCHNRIHKI